MVTDRLQNSDTPFHRYFWQAISLFNAVYYIMQLYLHVAIYHCNSIRVHHHEFLHSRICMFDRCRFMMYFHLAILILEPWITIKNRPILYRIWCVLQVKALPRSVTVRTVYEAGNWSYHVQHGVAWGNRKFTLSGLYSAPPTLDMGNQTLRGKPANPTRLCRDLHRSFFLL